MTERMEQVLIPGQDEEGSKQESSEDSALIRHLQSHTPAAFIALYDRFSRPVFRYLLHVTGSTHDSEELLQAVFASVWEGMTAGSFEKFDPRRGTVEGYLLGIARHRARKLLVRRSRTVSVDQFDLSDRSLELSAAKAGFAAVEQRSELQRLREAIVHLPIEYREAITLCCLQDLSYERAAKVMNCSVGTVGSRVNRGKALLRKALSASSGAGFARSLAEVRSI